ncbi:PREDICTED: uncharacterized protein LOC108778963 [Cyphomyrmex costatus]|uniref:uncharacterized protein LOC108778963 n=1 Tax=Cyphomyrmex costatus TaxID=456900 RepID=UPI000852458A|nr:PREDICTED: uncharacterized protein LOC108778963 [Cyphomyrmex costatus]
MPKLPLCPSCNRKIKSDRRMTRITDEASLNALKSMYNTPLEINAKVCDSCRLLSKRKITYVIDEDNDKPDENEDSTESPTNVKKVRLPISRCHSDQSKCIICKSVNGRNRITPQARLKVFVDYGILIPSNSRSCNIHLEDEFLTDRAVNMMELLPFSDLNANELMELLSALRQQARKAGLDFDNCTALTDEDYSRLTGLCKSQFDHVLECVRDNIRHTTNRSPRKCVALCLMKLRTGLSHSILSTLFAMDKRQIGRSIATARKALSKCFVPRYLGIEHISREEVISKHTIAMAKTLFTNNQDEAILVADGTYVYIQKSSNYSFQRKTFSVHKGRPLVKPMMIVTTTGYILDVLGPYYANGKNNDANIFTALLQSDSTKLRQWLKSNDVFVVDRGFRDCLYLLEDLNLVSKMPHFLERGKQHSTLEANESRLVTKVRWVVEAVNGLIKTWKALDHVFPNSQIPYIGEYVRIVCALCNAFRPPRAQNKPEDEIIGNRMMQLVSQPNHLQELVELEGWGKKRVIWEPLTHDAFNDFPKLTMDELTLLTLGVYQIKQAKSYTFEHLHDDGMYSLFIHKQERSIIRLQIQSRHTSSKLYNLWIQYNIGINPIAGWYCQCKAGARVVGCCAQCASVLWYLAYARYEINSTNKPSEKFNNHVMDASSCWTDDESSSESS